MRRNLLSPLLVCVLLLGGITASIGQSTNVIDFGSQWRYLITDTLPAGGWTNVNYPATDWGTGNAPFASDDEAMPGGVPVLQTVLDLNYNGNFVTSFYFRTTFNLVGQPSNFVFFANAVVDDGAVFYVNGRRVQNVRMTTGTVLHTTFATGDGGGDVSARPLDTFTIASSNFVQGANTVAVSLHQVNGTSTDVAFALQLRAEAIVPPVIVTHPESQTVQVGRRALFEVEATGTFLTYRWFANGTLVSSTTNSYLTPITSLGNDGTIYHVVVSNALGRVQSNPAILRVVPDTFGPEALFAIQVRSNWVDLRFDEVLNAAQLAATNASRLTNFAVWVLGTSNKLAITNLTLSASRTNVVLQLASVLGPPTNYVVCAYGILDGQSNAFATASTCAPLIFTNVFTLWSFGDVWRWNDSQWLVGSTAPTNLSPTIDWKHISYPDDDRNDLWREGTAPLLDDFNPPTLDCVTPVSGAGLDRTATTSYIRKRFTVSTNFPAGASLLLRHQIDDGAVFYLNGREIYRVNVPGAVGSVPAYSTTASSQVEGNCVNVTLNSVLTTNIIRGQNILAVEVHQFAEVGQVDWDTYFDVEMNVVWPVFPIIPELSITKTNISGSAGFRISWSTNALGWKLQSSAELTGPWADISPTPSTNFQATIPQGEPRRFYRLKNP